MDGIQHGSKQRNGFMGDTKPTEDGGPVIVEDRVSLKRSVRLIDGVAVVVGSVIGSGIFVSPKGVLRSSGSVGLSLIVWAVSGLIALCGGLCYSELAASIPHSGGQYTYIKMAMGDIVAFLVAWKDLVIDKGTSGAILLLTFANYFCSVFEMCGGPELPEKLTAIVAIIIIHVVNMRSSTAAVRANIIFTVAKVSALIAIIGGGMYKLSTGHTQTLETGFQGTVESPFSIALSFYSAMWAYDGWQALNTVTEEVKNPKKNIPRSIFLGLFVIIAIYMLTNVSYLTVLSVDELLNAPAVAMTWGGRVIGSAKFMIALTVAISTFGSGLNASFYGPRAIFVAARDGLLPEVLAFIHVHYYTPVPAMLLSMILGIVMVLAGDIDYLINFFGFVTWIFNGLTFASVIILRYKLKDIPRPIKVPLFIPVFLTLLSIYVVVAPIIYSPNTGYMYAFIFVLAGLLFYVPFVYYKKTFKFIDTLTMYTQLLLEVAPPKSKEKLQSS